MYQALGFDLDNTLYDQSQHLRSFFREAGLWLSERASVPAAAAEDCFTRVWERRTMSYPFLFDEALQELGLWRGDWVEQLVQSYRAHRCPLTLGSGVRNLLTGLASRYPLFLITDGFGMLQRFKVDRLGVAEYFRVIVYTGDHGPGWHKPSANAFLAAAQRLDLPASDCLYVGDDPERDVAGARAAGMSSARVLQGPYRTKACEPPPDFVLPCVTELEAALSRSRRLCAAT